MSRIYVGDTETTGVGPEAKVVEIAWVEIDEGFNVLQTVRSLINPECHIPASASAIHGITDKDVANAPTLDEFMDGFKWANSEGESYLVAHNAPFDLRFFYPYMPNLMGSVCTLKLARLFVGDAENHQLQTLKFHLDLEAQVEHHEAHTALADVKVTLELLRYISLASGLEFHELLSECNRPRTVTTWPFGKYKGMKLAAAPLSYVQWALKNIQNLDPDLRRSLESL